MKSRFKVPWYTKWTLFLMGSPWYVKALFILVLIEIFLQMVIVVYSASPGYQQCQPMRIEKLDSDRFRVPAVWGIA